MDIKEIQSLIKFVAKSGASEVKLEMDDLKITIKTGSPESSHETTYVQQIPMAQAAMAPGLQPQVQAAIQKPNGDAGWSFFLRVRLGKSVDCGGSQRNPT